MPPDLTKAHAQLDKAVDAAFGYKGGKDDATRVAFLFEQYQKLIAKEQTELANEAEIPRTKPATKCSGQVKKAKPWKSAACYFSKTAYAFIATTSLIQQSYANARAPFQNGENTQQET